MDKVISNSNGIVVSNKNSKIKYPKVDFKTIFDEVKKNNKCYGIKRDDNYTYLGRAHKKIEKDGDKIIIFLNQRNNTTNGTKFTEIKESDKPYIVSMECDSPNIVNINPKIVNINTVSINNSNPNDRTNLKPIKPSLYKTFTKAANRVSRLFKRNGGSKKSKKSKSKRYKKRLTHS